MTPSEGPNARQTAGAAASGRLGPGSVFAGYTIEKVIGRGGMGTVYVAQHPRLPRRDVLKLLNTSLSEDDNFRARFEREADLAGSLEHPNIVAVYDRGVDDDRLWIAMRFVRGFDAAALLRDHPSGVDPAFAVHIASEIGNGLDYAHRRGLVHRDIKPGNILIEADEGGATGAILLTDFGIARAVDDAMHLTDTGLTVASIPYASPEQLEGDVIDGRADIYALGCTFVQLLTGTPPYPRDNKLATMTAHLNAQPPALGERNDALGPEIDTVVAKVLAKAPDDRYESCAEFVAAAAAALGVETATGSSRTYSTMPRTEYVPPSESATAHITPRWRESGVGQHEDSGARRRVFTPVGNPHTDTDFVSRDDVTPSGSHTQQGGYATGTAAGQQGSRGTGGSTRIVVAALVVLALIAGIIGTVLYLDNRASGSAWPDATAGVADRFPRLLPDSPDQPGWNDTACTAALVTTAASTLDGIRCSAPNGLSFAVWHAPVAADRASIIEALPGSPGIELDWAEGPVSMSNEGTTEGWVVSGFYDAPREPYLIVGLWQGRSGREVLDDWWRDAPFGS